MGKKSKSNQTNDDGKSVGSILYVSDLSDAKSVY